eukprot:14266-Heterococcus_DN1.PRE.1
MEQLSKPLYVYCLTAVTDACGDVRNTVMRADKTTAWIDINVSNCDAPVLNSSVTVAAAAAAAAPAVTATTVATDATATHSNLVDCNQGDQSDYELLDDTAQHVALDEHSLHNSDHCERPTQQSAPVHRRARRGKLIHTSKALAGALHTVLNTQLSEVAAKTLFARLDTDSSGTLNAYDIVYGLPHILSLINSSSNSSSEVSTVQKRQRRKPRRTVLRPEQCDSSSGACHEAVDSPKTAGLKLHDYWSAQVQQHQQQSLQATVAEQQHSSCNSNSSRMPRAMSKAIDSTQRYSGDWQPPTNSSRMSTAAALRESIYT